MAKPTFVSRTPGDTDITTARVGAGLLGLPLLPQGEQVARVLEARTGRQSEEARHQDVVVEIGRRASKTTSVWSTILGRAQTREEYRAVTTAQRGVVASRVLIEMAQAMIRNGTAVESREWGRNPDKPALYRNAGRERIVWPNGNEVWAVPPDPGAVRSAAANDIVVDEGGELDVVKGQDFIDAVRPLQDTRGPLAQFILMGTPGKVRVGPFWDLLEKGRNRADRTLGIVDYSIRDSEDADDRKVWRRVHPGPASGLTPMKVLEKRYKDMGPIAFAREYLCRWPFDNTVAAIDALEWKAQEVAAVSPPEWCGVGVDCEPNGMAAAVAIGWRVAGVPMVALVDYRPGTTWAPARVRQLRESHQRVPVAIDRIGANTPVIEDLERGAGRRKVEVIVPGFKAVQGASQSFVQRLPVHTAQPDLERAVEAATWREVEGGRLFSRKRSDADVSPLVACVLALWAYDNRPERQRMGLISSNADTPA